MRESRQDYRAKEAFERGQLLHASLRLRRVIQMFGKYASSQARRKMSLSSEYWECSPSLHNYLRGFSPVLPTSAILRRKIAYASPENDNKAFLDIALWAKCQFCLFVDFGRISFLSVSRGVKEARGLEHLFQLIKVPKLTKEEFFSLFW